MRIITMIIQTALCARPRSLWAYVVFVAVVMSVTSGDVSTCDKTRYDDGHMGTKIWMKYANEKDGVTKMLQETTAWGSQAGNHIGRSISHHPLIVCVGYGRTGTTSLEHALRILGLNAEHYTPKTLSLVHLVEQHHIPGSLPEPEDGVSGEYSFPVSWVDALEDIDAVLDAPVPSLYLEILDAFPRAKVILTVRDPNVWIKSHRGHFDLFCDDVKHANVTRFTTNATHQDKKNNHTFDLNKDTNTFYTRGMDVSPNRMLDFGTNCPSSRQALRRYIAHNLEVINNVPPDNLLVLDFTSGDGWEQLCPFLGVEIPSVPFPRIRRD